MRSQDLVHLLQTRSAPDDEIILRFYKGKGPKHGVLQLSYPLDLGWDDLDMDAGNVYIDMPSEIFKMYEDADYLD